MPTANRLRLPPPPTPISIIHVVPAITIGGLLRELQITEHLPADKFQSTIISIFDLDEEAALSSLVGPLVRLRFPATAYRDEAVICDALLHHFRVLQATLVHSYHCFADFYSIQAAYRLGIPFIRSVLGITQASWDAPLNRAQVLVDWADDVLEKELGVESKVSCTIVVSKDLKARLVAHGFCADKLEVSYPGVSLEAAQEWRPRGPTADGCTTIGFLHRIEPIKRPLDLLELGRLLQARGVHTLILYPRIGSMLREFESAVAASGLDKQFAGFSSNANLWSPAISPDLLLITSQSEGVPRVMLEAMARGIPVVAAKVGGIPEVIDDSVSGYLFEVGDLATAADIIMRLCNSSVERSRIARAAERVVVNRFSSHRQIADLLSVYEHCLRNVDDFQVGHQEA
jgi:glycosyltransferase involved in cell wall biosynthesis